MSDFGYTDDDKRQHIASLRAKGVSINSGLSAIQPYLDTIPAFTEDDVRQYVLTHHFSRGNITYVEEPKLERIVYTDSQEACNQTKTFVSYEKEQMVFFAELSGTFAFSGGPPPGKKDTFNTVFVVFDAQTGNILVSSFRR